VQPFDYSGVSWMQLGHFCSLFISTFIEEENLVMITWIHMYQK
jgi:hypothetical protein